EPDGGVLGLDRAEAADLEALDRGGERCNETLAGEGAIGIAVELVLRLLLGIERDDGECRRGEDALGKQRPHAGALQRAEQVSAKAVAADGAEEPGVVAEPRERDGAVIGR